LRKKKIEKAWDIILHNFIEADNPLLFMNSVLKPLVEARYGGDPYPLIMDQNAQQIINE